MAKSDNPTTQAALKAAQQIAEGRKALNTALSRVCPQSKAISNPRLLEAVDWAITKSAEVYAWTSPRVISAWRKGLIAAAPKISEAAEALTPVVDKASDKLIDDVIPSVVEAVSNAAAAAAQAGAETFSPTSIAGPASLASKASKPVTKKKHRGRRLLGLLGLTGILAGIGYLLWRQTQPLEDPWDDDEWDDDTESDSTETAENKTDDNKLEDAEPTAVEDSDK